MARAPLTALYDVIQAPGQPKSFDERIDVISPLYLVVVFGEHDNAFQP